jgi:uridine kinase
VERLSLDDFYLDRSHLSPARRARLNFDHPRAIDWKALEKILHQARRGEAVTLPCYDFQTHCRLKKKRELLSGPVLIMDGLWLLRRPSLRKFFDIKIYIDCPGKVRLERRIRRDVAERGRDAASVKRQFKDTVEPMHARFVAAQSSFANVRLSKDFGEKTVLDLARQIRERIAESAKAGKNRSRPAGATSRRLARDRK